MWDGVTWNELHDGSAEGVNNEVFSLESDGTDAIYVGGMFTTAGSVTASRVAKWDVNLEEWAALSDGVLEGANDNVNALVFDDDNLYTGGKFTQVGETPANRIARWDVDGKTWYPITVGGPGDHGMDNTVYDVFLDKDNNLFAAGIFTTADGLATANIAR